MVFSSEKKLNFWLVLKIVALALLLRVAIKTADASYGHPVGIEISHEVK